MTKRVSPQNPAFLNECNKLLVKENAKLKEQVKRLTRQEKFPKLRELNNEEEQLLLELCEFAFPGFEAHIAIEPNMRGEDTVHICFTDAKGNMCYYHWLEILDIIIARLDDITGGNTYDIYILHREIVKQ